MKKAIWVLFIITSLSCSQNKPEYSPIYIRATSVKPYVVENLSVEYVEINLGSSEGDFIAMADNNPITGKEGVVIRFKNPTDFLNFMSGGGYDLVAQVKNKYGADYTFKKKPY